MPRFNPEECQVEAFTDSTMQIWPLPTQRRGRRARAAEPAPECEGDAGSSDVVTPIVHGPGADGSPRESEVDETGSNSSDAESLEVSSEDGSETQDSQEQQLEELLVFLMHEQIGVAESRAGEAAEVEETEPAAAVPDPDEQGADVNEREGSQLSPASAADAASCPPTPPAAEPDAPALQVAPALPPAGAAAAAAPPELVPRPGRLAAEVVVQVEGGFLSYYRQGVFTATCSNPLHQRCVLTRTAKGGRSEAQGRPLGLLTA